MISSRPKYLHRLDARYGDQPYFELVLARLLAGLCVLILAFVPLNVLKLLWVQPPGLSERLGLSMLYAVSAAGALWLVWKGRRPAAGSFLVLALLVPAHLLALLYGRFAEPVAVAFQLFMYDLIVLLIALVFAAWPVAVVVLGIALLTHFLFHQQQMSADVVAGSLHFTADTIFRDGLIAIGFVFVLGMTLTVLIRSAQRRSEVALEATRELNRNLEGLVAERTREMEVAMRRASEASQAKGEFLANMSHEIRTPLNGVVAVSDLLLQRDDLAAEVRDHVRLIAESGDHLLRLIGNVLDLSKIEAGRLHLESDPFDLQSLANETITLLTASAHSGGVQIDASVDPAVSQTRVGDSLRIRQVLLNLMSNAIKFTPTGGRIRLKISGGEGGENFVHFAVRDTGVGMNAETLSRVFQRYEQGDQSTARRFGGTGLGLEISSRFVRLMEGRLHVESELGTGSEFSFSIPLELADSDAGTAPVQDTVGLAPLGQTVLIVDDNNVNLKVLAAQLKRLGCTTRSAGDGAEAIAELQAGFVPDVVLMDCEMPGIDGWEATRRIRAWVNDSAAPAALRSIAQVRIVALTAAIRPEERERAFTAGMNAFLTKPVKLAELHRALSV